MSLPKTPRAWASRLTTMLNTVIGPDRFPVSVSEIALEYTAQVYPGDRIIRVDGADLPGFDGALLPVPGKKAWGIIYNSGISSRGQINFTLAHEFGHYLLHRLAHPQGIQCVAGDIAGGSDVVREIEREADLFAADLLMPFDDLRRQLAPVVAADIEMLSALADRYRVSLLAAILRWLSYTERRAVLVVAREGFILWSRASEPALKTGAFFRTSKRPIEVPEASLVARQDMLEDNRSGVQHRPGVWFYEPVKEMTVFSDQYDFAISLLLLGDAPEWRRESDDDGDAVAVPVDVRFSSHPR